MAWIQVGTKKINTSVVTYMEQTGETLRLFFGGGGEMELAGQEAAGLWRTLKAENALTAKDVGSTTTLPKYSSTTSAPPKSIATPSVTVHRPHTSSSPSSSHSH